MIERRYDRLYRRLVSLIDGTALQLESFARVAATGEELNGYSSEFGLLAPGERMMGVSLEEVSP